MAVFNEPTKWQTSLVNSGDANTIPQNTPVGTGKASFDDGFPQITQVPIGAGGIAPDRKDFNGLFKILGNWIFYAQNGGLPTYSADFDYIVGRVVLYNGNIYKCIQANGASSTVVAPDSDDTYWQQIDNVKTDLANKADRDLSNVPSSKGILVESYVNGQSGYRVYSDGFCEQWGTAQTVSDALATANFLKNFRDTNYHVNINFTTVLTNNYTTIGFVNQNLKTVSSFQFTCNIYPKNNPQIYWFACGFVS